MRSPEPGSFERLLREVQLEADTLIRLSRWPATEPWWSRGVYRFDGPAAGIAGSFGTCYAAQDLSVAFAESVLHGDGWFHNGHFQVPTAALTGRHVVRLRRPAKPTLLLADLTGAGLKALGLDNDLSAGSDYTGPMAWAQAIHAADPAWDGIRYVSRQHNDKTAVALFKRSGISKGRSHRLAGKALECLCDAFGVVAV